jgi:diadenylate cyclase
MRLQAIFTNLRIQDVLDILFLAFLAYYLFLWFRGTKAFNALVGLLALGVVYTLAQSWGLFMTTWVFHIFWQVLVLLIIILFQSEIRQVLERVDPLQAFGFRKKVKPGKWLQSFSEGVFSLAERRIGALLIIERNDRVEQWISRGQDLQGDPNREVLMTVFKKESPLHDGAAVIRDGRMILVTSYLPLSTDENLPKEWGTRHRAAMGLSEKSDALIVVASEERGKVTLLERKKVLPAASPEQLSRLLQECMGPVSSAKMTWRHRLKSLLCHQWKIKGGAFALVLFLWLLLAGQQNFEVALTVPMELKNVPARMEVVEPLDPSVRIRVRGLRKDAGTLTNKNVHAELDLSAAAAGRTVFAITREDIILPKEGVSVVGIEPPHLIFKFRQKSSP